MSTYMLTIQVEVHDPRTLYDAALKRATLVEFLRHHTAVRERSGAFKIDGNWVPSMAHLFALRHPQHAGLLEFRS